MKKKAENQPEKALPKWKQLRFWMPCVSALLMLGAFPPFNIVVLLFVGLVPLLQVLVTAESGKEAFRAGNRFGLVYMLGQLLFIFILANRWTGNAALAILPWLASGAIAQLYFGLAGLSIFYVFGLASGPKRWAFSLLIPLAWAGVEVFRSQIPFIGFPWGLLATPLWRYPVVIGLARFTTVFGLSAWIVSVNLVVLYSTLKDHNGVRRFCIVAAGLLAMSCLQYFKGLEPVSDELRVMCLQPGVDQAFGDARVEEAEQAQNIGLLLDEAEDRSPDLIVLPEGVARLGDEITPNPPFTLPRNSAIIFGAQRGTEPPYQSVFGFDGRNWSHADKTRLVIFGEYVPGRKIFGFLNNFHLAEGDIEPGKRVDPLTLDFPKSGRTKIGPLVCYEGLFYDIAAQQSANGARLLTVVSIDDWFMGSPAPEQLEAAAVFRSVETNLPTVRAASTGYTMACDNKGNLLAEIPLEHMRAMPVTVSVPLFPQPSWWLGLFPWGSFLITTGLLFVSPFLSRKPQTTEA